ncbi:hypothetical protein ACF049_07735 [Cellulosimicrobium funkei]|uniref:hypothetical protein n=1 Tax=Cellulosimicrobium funkei TaxID=264251 RepID=UPI0036F91B6A
MVSSFDHKVMLIKLTQDVDAGDPDALYAATRAWWKVAEKRRSGAAESPEIALAVRDGVVVGAYEIDGWRGPGGPEGDRWAFDGHRRGALDERYVGVDVSDHYPRGAQNPVRYVL